MSNNKYRVPSETVFLPPMKVIWAVTDPNRPENKFDPEKKAWSLRLVSTNEANRKNVEALLGPFLPRFFEMKKAELIEEAGDNKIKLRRLEQGDDKVGPVDIETPWRERISRETGEPTGELELMLKRDEFRIDRRTKQKVRNAPPLVIDAHRKPVLLVPPPGSIVIAKMATWPVFFAADNKIGMKRLLEACQIVSMPQARTPDASGFEEIDDGYSAEDRDEGGSEASSGSRPVAGADY